MSISHKVISGGQTGADRGGLYAALDLDIPIGGWAPRGYRAEDGKIPEYLQGFLEDCSSLDYRVRTKKNVKDSDGTLLFHGGPMTPGTSLTRWLCLDLGRPVFAVNTLQVPDSAVVLEWFWINGIRTLNVAGSRESKAPGIQEWVQNYLKSDIFPKWLERAPSRLT